MTESFDLDRFVKAQEPIMADVRRELGAGQKRSHWMWFVFPQMAGLGQSPTARHYALASLAEATAYAAHPVLGPRLAEVTDLVLRIKGKSVREIFGSPDDLKFHSSMTLFAVAAPDVAAYHEALTTYFKGVPDQQTADLLAV
jgi:uncharacterized protein (DUF1810 family)